MDFRGCASAEGRKMATFEPIQTRPQSLSEQVYESIREAIISRRLAPGDRVTEAKLAGELAVSKTPVREALLRLEYIGLIEADGLRGGRIARSSGGAIRRAYEIRAGVECQAARIVAQSGTSEDIANLRELAEACLSYAKMADRAGFREYDRRLHLALAEGTGNPLLARMVHDSFDLTWILRQRDVPIASGSLECAQQHLEIVRALENHDPEQADRAMRAHINKVETLVFVAIDNAADAASEKAKQPT